MSRAQKIFSILMVFIPCAVLFFPLLSIASTVDSCATGNQNDTNSFTVTVLTNGTTIKNTSGGNLNLDSATFYLKKVGTPTGNMTAQLYALTGSYGSTGTGTGSVLATSGNVDVSTLSTSFSSITFSFTGGNRYLLLDNTAYALVVNYPSAVAGNLVLGLSSSNTCASNWTRINTGSWEAPDSTYDAIFTVTGLVDSSGSSESSFTSATSTEALLGSISFGIAILTGFAFLGIAGFIYNSMNKKKPWLS
jgi:hypothetical protein